LFAFDVVVVDVLDQAVHVPHVARLATLPGAGADLLLVVILFEPRVDGRAGDVALRVLGYGRHAIPRVIGFVGYNGRRRRGAVADLLPLRRGQVVCHRLVFKVRGGGD